MRPPLDGAVVLLTGASAGIGAALARELAPRVRVLIMTARRTERLESLAAELRQHSQLTVQVEGCDLTNRAALAALIARIETQHEGVDILINNAGRGDFGLYERADWDAKEQILELNVRAPSYLMQRFTPYMVRRGRGGILNISSGIALMPLFPGMATYAASKHYVMALSESLRAELATTGVVVTVACPGPVASEFMDVARAGPFDRPPPFLVQSAESCARECMRGFERGRALVLPGALNRITSFMVRAMPRVLLRIAMGPLANTQRKKALAAETPKRD